MIYDVCFSIVSQSLFSKPGWSHSSQ